MALYHFKRNGDQANPDEFRKGVAKFAISGGLLALPQITDIVVNTLGLGPDFLGLIWAGGMPGDADIASIDAKSLAYKSIGQMVALPQVVTIISYILGVAFCFYGLLKLKSYSDNPGQGGVREALGRFGIGAALLSLPRVSSVLMMSLGLDGLTENSFASRIAGLSAGSVTGESGGAPDNVENVQSLIVQMTDQATAIPLVIVIASFVGATIMVVSGLLSLKKHIDDPSQSLKTPIGQLAIAGVFFGLPVFVDVVLSTLGLDFSESFDVIGEAYSVVDPENANNFSTLVSNGRSLAYMIGMGVKPISFIVGTFLIAIGLLSLKRNFEAGGQQEPLRIGLGKVAMGGAILALPGFTKLLLQSLGLVRTDWDSLWGSSPELGEESGGLLGLIDVVIQQFSTVSSLMLLVAMVTGIVLIFSGLLSLKRHMEDPRSETIPKALVRLGIGAALVALDFYGEIVGKTLGLSPDVELTAPDGYAAGNGDLDTSGQIGGVLRYLTGQLSGIEGILFLIASIAGVFFIFLSLMSLKKHVDDPNSETIDKPIVSALIGGSFFALAALVPVLMAVFKLETMDVTGFTGLATPDGLGSIGGLSAADADGNSVGASVIRLQENVIFYGGLLEIISYLLGVGFLMVALWKFKQHVDQPTQLPIWEPVKHLAAAAGFLGLPALASTIISSMQLSGAGSVNASEFNFGEGPSGGALDDMFIRLATDIVPSVLSLLEVFVILAGLSFMMLGVHRLTKGAQEGPNGPLGLGTAFTFLVGSILLATPEMMGLFSNTIFGTDTVKVNAILGFLDGDESGLVERTQQVFSAITAFMVLIGFISFVRGWFILKSYAEGNQQATLMAASSHIIAGVLAVNIGPLINAVQVTLGVDLGGGVSFN